MAQYYLSTSEVAEALGINLNTLNSRIQAGEFLEPDAILGSRRYQGWLPATITDYRDRDQYQPLPDIQVATEVILQLRVTAEAIRVLDTASADGRAITSDLYAVTARLESHIRDLLLDHSEVFCVPPVPSAANISTIDDGQRRELLCARAYTLTEIASRVRELMPDSQAAMYVERITMIAQRVRSR